MDRCRTHGLYGRIFGSEVSALRFAKFESGGRRSSISMTSQPVHLYGAADKAA
jgi:hypothetical protein